MHLLPWGRSNKISPTHLHHTLQPHCCLGVFLSGSSLSLWVKMWVCWQVIAAKFQVPIPHLQAKFKKKKEKVIIWLK